MSHNIETPGGEPRPGPGHLLHYLPERVNTVLDIGCNVGEMLFHAARLGARKGIGIDVNVSAIEQARRRFAGNTTLEFHVCPSQKLFLPDGSVDVVLLSEVLEHIPQKYRRRTIEEIGRVLRPGGKLLLSVPFHSLTNVLDPENMRFRLPKLYSFVSRRLGGGGREAGFQDTGFKVEWHHHFKIKEIEDLFDGSLVIESIRYRGAFVFPLAEWMIFPLIRRGCTENAFYRFLRRIQAADFAYESWSPIAYDIIVLGRKRPRE